MGGEAKSAKKSGEDPEGQVYGRSHAGEKRHPSEGREVNGPKTASPLRDLIGRRGGGEMV